MNAEVDSSGFCLCPSCLNRDHAAVRQRSVCPREAASPIVRLHRYDPTLN